MIMWAMVGLALTLAAKAIAVVPTSKESGEVKTEGFR